MSWLDAFLQGPPGNAGPGSWSTATNAFVMPASGATNVFNTSNTGWLKNGLYVTVNDGTNQALLQVQSFVPGASAILLNPTSPQIPQSVAPGTNFAIGATMQASAPPAGPLGSQQIGSALYNVVPIPQALVLPSGGNQILWTMPLPAIAIGEFFVVEATINYSSVSTTDFGCTVLRLLAKNMGGTIESVSGGLTGIDVSSPAYPFNVGPGGNLNTVANGGLSLSIVGNSAVEVIANVSSVPIAVTGVQFYGQVGFTRFPGQSSGTAVTVVSASVTSGPGQGGTTTTLQVSPSTTGITGVTLDGITASFVVVDSTHLTATSGPLIGGSPGTGAIVVTNGGGPSVGGPTWTYTDWPGAIFGANSSNYLPNTIVQSSGVVSGWNDPTSGNNLTVGSVGGGTTETSPSYNASSAVWTPASPSVSFNGVANALSRAVFTVPASNNLFFWIVAKVTSTGTVICEYGPHATFILTLSGTAPAAYFDGRQATYGGSISAVPRIVTAYADGAGQTNGVSIVSVSNTSPVTATATETTAPANAQIVLGGASSNAFFSAMEVVAFGVAFGLPTGGPSGAQLSRLEAWAQSSFGVP